MDVQHPDEDERLVRWVLTRAFPAERPVFSQRRGAQIVRAAAVERAAVERAAVAEAPRRRRPRRPRGGWMAALVAAALALFGSATGTAGQQVQPPPAAEG